MTTSASPLRPRRRGLRRLPRAGWVRLLVLIAGVALIVVLGWVLLFSPVFGVRTVRIEGAAGEALDEDLGGRIEGAVGVAAATPMLRVDPAEVAGRVLEQTPTLEQVTVHRSWPNTVVVVAQPRVAALAVATPHGWDLFDHEGVVVSTGLAHPPSSLPTVDDAGSPAAAAAVAEVLPTLPNRVAKKVETISASTTESLTFTLRDGRRVVWGSPDRSEEKGRVLAALLKVDATTYDVSAPDLPTTRG